MLRHLYEELSPKTVFVVLDDFERTPPIVLPSCQLLRLPGLKVVAAAAEKARVPAATIRLGDLEEVYAPHARLPFLGVGTQTSAGVLG
eukprot:6201034-Pleurochrysis_carterae.AAC.1